MYNQTDIKHVEYFIKGTTISTKEITEQMFKMGKKVPDTITFITKKENSMGEVEHNMCGGIVPKDDFGRFLNGEIVPKIIKMKGETILCKCETIFSGNTIKIKFTNYITNEEQEKVFEFNVTPLRVSDINSFMGEPICLN